MQTDGGEAWEWGMYHAVIAMVDFLLPYVRGEDVPACFLGYQGQGAWGDRENVEIMI